MSDRGAGGVGRGDVFGAVESEAEDEVFCEEVALHRVVRGEEEGHGLEHFDLLHPHFQEGHGRLVHTPRPLRVHVTARDQLLDGVQAELDKKKLVNMREKYSILSCESHKKTKIYVEKGVTRK